MKTAAHLTAAAERGLHRDGTHRLRRAFSKVATTALLAGALLILAPIGQGVAITTLDNLFIHLKTPLEQRFARPPEGILLGITGIVILGGSYSRIDEAARIAARLPHSRIVLTGADRREETRLARLGVQGGRLTIERDAKSTYQNAVYSRRAVGPQANERWLLVTSALHMPRAIGTFRAAGFPVEAWPVEPPPRRRQHVVARVRREVLGLAAYRLLGRTSELFPSPVGPGRPARTHIAVGKGAQEHRQDPCRPSRGI